MKRFLLILLVVSTSAPLSAFTTTGRGSASQNTSIAHAVQEPVISVISVNGATHANVAFMYFDVNGGSGSVIKVSHAYADTYDFASWSAPAELSRTVGGYTYEHSADPVFLEFGSQTFPYPNRIYCFGTLYSGTPAHDTHSTIGAWHSDDGGLSWSGPEVLDTPPQPAGCDGSQVSHSCIFDDKPAAGISQASGVVYLAFTRTTAQHIDPNTGQSIPATTAVYMEEMLSSRGWISMGQIGESNMPELPGPTPVVDPTTDLCWLFMRGCCDQDGKPIIRTFVGNAGSPFTEIAERATAEGFFSQMTVNVAGTTVEAVPFLTVKFDNLYHHMFVVYHRQITDPNTGQVKTQVVWRRFVPFSHAWTGTGVIADNGHRQWNPAVAQLSSGDFIVTYYDYNPSDSGYLLYASHQNIYAQWIDTSVISTTYTSSPAGYNTQGSSTAHVGEYQGLTAFNNTLYASSIDIQSSVGNAIATRFIP